jgi:hypothetical protein
MAKVVKFEDHVKVKKYEDRIPKTVNQLWGEFFRNQLPLGTPLELQAFAHKAFCCGVRSVIFELMQDRPVPLTPALEYLLYEWSGQVVLEFQALEALKAKVLGRAPQSSNGQVPS